jgi:dnd system-associated protein 4
MSDVRRPKEHEEMMRDLCQSENAIFGTYKDCLVFAACLGFSKNQFRSFEKSAEPVSTHIFHGEYDETIFQAISLAEIGDPMIMAEAAEEKRIKLFEEYACGGLDIIKQRIYESPEGWENAFVSLITEEYPSNRTILEDITDLK